MHSLAKEKPTIDCKLPKGTREISIRRANDTSAQGSDTVVDLHCKIKLLFKTYTMTFLQSTAKVCFKVVRTLRLVLTMTDCKTNRNVVVKNYWLCKARLVALFKNTQPLLKSTFQRGMYFCVVNHHYGDSQWTLKLINRNKQNGLKSTNHNWQAYTSDSVQFPTVAHICHSKTYFSTAKHTFLRQNLLYHGKTYFLKAKLTFSHQNLLFHSKRTFLQQNILFHSKIYYLTAKLTFMAKLRWRDLTWI